MTTFLRLWAGQSVSLVGSALTSFALGVWVYQQTGSVTGLGLVYLLVFLPAIVVSPFTGALADRLDRRVPLIAAAVGGILLTLALAALAATDQLRPWHVYVTTAVSSVLGALQLPAFGATVGLLVPQRHLGRANGLVMLAQSVAQIIGPLAGGLLIGALGLRTLILADCASFVFALASVLSVRIPRPPQRPAADQDEEEPAGLLSAGAQSRRWIAARPGLVALLAFYAVLNFAVGFVDVLITPLVLGFAGTDGLGTVLAVGGTGMVVGSVLMSLWGGPRRRVHGVLGFSALLGAALTVGALRASVVWVAAAAFGFLFCSALINAGNRSLWQAKVDPELQGRVIALENMVATIPLPLAYLLAGPVTDHVMAPLVSGGGGVARLAAALVGDRPSAPMAALLLLCGLVVVAASGAGYLHPRLRRVDTELPDALPAPADPAPPHPRAGQASGRA
ncbi:MFS transporter [Kitasatospora sp. NPDC089509]|uniref:MFS transporter n=1 Tax=Kitasatospora sp. NPDC089509 TaxID=3364079 RepID=UPI00380CE123